MAEDVFSRDYSGEEYAVGNSKCFNKKNYQADFKGPTWDELLTLLADVEIHRMAILFCGRAGSDGQVGSTGWGIVDRADVQQVLYNAMATYNAEDLAAIKAGLPRPPKVKYKDFTTSRNMTPVFAVDLLKLNVQPIHITGIYVRKIS